MKILSYLLSFFLLMSSSSCRAGTEQVEGFPPTSDHEAAQVQRLMLETVEVEVAYEVMIPSLQTKNMSVAFPSTSRSAGTGVVLKVKDGKTMVVTAAHVSKVQKMFPSPRYGPLPVTSSQTIILDLSRQPCKAKEVYSDELRDVSILEAECEIGAPALLDLEAPPAGARVMTVGCPTAFHPMFTYAVNEGFYQGFEIDEFDGGVNAGELPYDIIMTYSIPATFGSSGSGVFYRNKLIGLLSGVSSEFEHITLGSNAIDILHAAAIGEERIWPTP